MRLAWRLFAGFCLLGASGCEQAGEAQITLDQSVRLQTISGWEATAEIGGPPREHGSPPWADALLDRVVDDVGVNRIRLEVRSGVESDSRAWTRLTRGEISGTAWRPLRYATRNDNDDPFNIDESGFDFTELDWRVETVVLPMAERLQARGERLYVNLCYVSFMGQGENLPYHHDTPEEYAEFMLATFRHLKAKYDLVPDGVEVILEPDLTPYWSVDGGRKIGAAIEATAKRLGSEGFRPEFIAPSVTSMANAAPYIRQILENEHARDRIAEFSYHRYQGASPERAREIAAIAADNKKRSAMLEYWLGNGAPDVLFEDLTDGMNSAWQGRALSGHFMVSGEGEDARLTIQPEVHYNRIFFRAARAGAVRVKAATDNPAFKPVAFENADGRMAVVIKAEKRGAVTINAPAGVYRIEMALDGQFLRSEARATGDKGVPIVFPSKGYASATLTRAQ
jgi:hypothetical protein